MIPSTCSERFEIIRLLGTGGFAAVYLANQKALGREVVIKILDTRVASDAQQVERFRAEALLDQNQFSAAEV